MNYIKGLKARRTFTVDHVRLRYVTQTDSDLRSTCLLSFFITRVSVFLVMDVVKADLLTAHTADIRVHNKPRSIWSKRIRVKD